MEDDKVETVFPLPVWALIVAFVLCWPAAAFSKPMAQAQVEGITITLHNDPCTMPEITNLKMKATWLEKGKTFEGCWGAHPQYGLVMFYWSDKTVVVLPGDAFAPVTVL